MNDYWLVEIPDAKQRLTYADQIMQRDCRALLLDFIAFEGHWDRFRLLKGLFWALLGAGLMYAAIWGIFAL